MLGALPIGPLFQTTFQARLQSVHLQLDQAPWNSSIRCEAVDVCDHEREQVLDWEEEAIRHKSADECIRHYAFEGHSAGRVGVEEECLN
mmetsp:Transcript_13649/g.19912  ORF Transcript_13649/g.19912 Transcript_13649/m.19912 type:complete len:89 (-) Transcript_13649:59-325(-)